MLNFEKYKNLRVQRFGRDKYFVDRRGYSIVYTDGSSIGNHGPGERYSGWATFWGPRNGTSTESESDEPRENTNQAAEIRGVLDALR